VIGEAWNDEHPSAGDPDRIRADAAVRTDAAGDVRRAVVLVQQAVELAQAGSWSGEARVAFTGRAGPTVPALEFIATGFEHQATVLREYAAAIDTLRGEEDQLVAERADLRSRRASLVRSLDDPFGDDPFGIGWSARPSILVRTGTTSVAEAERAEADRRTRADIDDLDDDLAHLDRRWQQLIDDRRAADADAARRLHDEVVLGSAWRIDDGTVASASAARLLGYLEGASGSDLTAILDAHPELLDRLATAEADDVAGWWASLPDEAKAAVLIAAPALLGGLAGIPFAIRDGANRRTLATEIAALRAGGVDRGRLDDLLAISQALGPVGQHPPRQLISLDPDAEPKPLAAISVGDLDLATHATFQVSGMFSSTSDMGDAVGDARALYVAEADLIRLHGLTAAPAVVAWIGYASPDAITVVGDDHARAGADLLARDLRAYADTVGTGTHLAIDAHSYGTTTAALALTQSRVSADAFAMYGSAGIVESISMSDLHVPADRVFVGETPDDPWAPIGRFLSGRENPGDWPDARRFATAGGGADPASGTPYVPASGHGEYLVPHTESVRNLALINLDLVDEVVSDRLVLAPGAPTSAPNERPVL